MLCTLEAMLAKSSMSADWPGRRTGWLTELRAARDSSDEEGRRIATLMLELHSVSSFSQLLWRGYEGEAKRHNNNRHYIITHWYNPTRSRYALRGLSCSQLGGLSRLLSRRQ